MELLLAITIGVLYAASFYLILRRSVADEEKEALLRRSRRRSG